VSALSDGILVNVNDVRIEHIFVALIHIFDCGTHKLVRGARPRDGFLGGMHGFAVRTIFLLLVQDRISSVIRIRN
jgi:hypothetical protein